MANDEEIPVSSGKGSKPPVSTKTNFITDSKQNLSVESRNSKASKSMKASKKSSSKEKNKG